MEQDGQENVGKVNDGGGGGGAGSTARGAPAWNESGAGSAQAMEKSALKGKEEKSQDKGSLNFP